MVFWYQESLLPTHKHESSLSERLLANSEPRTAHFGFDGCAGGSSIHSDERARQRTSKRVETAPMGHVVHFRSAIALCEKSKFGACVTSAKFLGRLMGPTDDLCIKVGGELGVVVGEVFDGEVTAQSRTRKVDVLDRW